MRVLRLRDIDTNTPHIENLKLDYYYIPGGTMSCILRKDDIKCGNEDEILDAFRRKAKPYFHKIRSEENHVALYVNVGRRLFGLGSRGAEQIEEARENMEEAFQNTVDDVFGVGCVEVE